MSNNSNQTHASRKQKVQQQSPDQGDELLVPSAEEFKVLCQLASFIQQLAPWEFMNETDLFGVKDPDTGELGFVSVMGALGEYTAIAVYRGAEGLYAWREFEELLQIDAESEEAHDMLLEIPHLQLVFGPPDFIEKRDREIIKSSGLKFGKLKPSFRSYRPGYLPWFLARAEASQLIYALIQTINIAKQFDEDQDVIPVNENPEDKDYLIGIPEVHGSEVQWDYSIQQIDPPPRQLIPFSVEGSIVNQLKEIPKSGAHEMELFTLPARVGKRHERPRLIYAFLVADSASGLILGFEALEGVDGIDLMYASLPEKLFSRWLEYELVPAELRARSVRLLNVFQPLASELGLVLELVTQLPAIDEAKSSIIEQLQGG